MTKAQTIEIVVLKVAEYYGLDWRVLFNGSKGRTRIKGNLFRMIKEFVSDRDGNDYMFCSRAYFQHLINDCSDRDCLELSELIKMQLNTSYKKAS